jgi:lysozyme
MRLKAATSFAFTCLLLAGCSATSAPEDALTLAPSPEMTASVIPNSGPVPPEAISVASVIDRSDSGHAEPALAWAGNVPENPAASALSPALPVPTIRPQLASLPASARATAPHVRSRVYSSRFRDAKPINFGKASPHKHAVHGVDVSRWQGDIDWPKLKTEGANFAFIKATDGGDHIDPMFMQNWRATKQAGVRRGAYHFFYWCRTAGEQADWFIRNVPRNPEALPPVIDVEWNHESSCKRRPSPEKVREKMQVFMDKLERHYGKRPIIYTAPDFYEDNLKGAFKGHPFWLRSVAVHPSKIYPGRKWMFWQYSGSGVSHGVEGRIDLNTYNGSVDDWLRWLAQHS